MAAAPHLPPVCPSARTPLCPRPPGEGPGLLTGLALSLPPKPPSRRGRPFTGSGRESVGAPWVWFPPPSPGGSSARGPSCGLRVRERQGAQSQPPSRLEVAIHTVACVSEVGVSVKWWPVWSAEGSFLQPEKVCLRPGNQESLTPDSLGLPPAARCPATAPAAHSVPVPAPWAQLAAGTQVSAGLGTGPGRLKGVPLPGARSSTL